MTHTLILALFPVTMSILLLVVRRPILRLPSWAQPIVPILATGIPVALGSYEQYGIASACIMGLVAGLETIGVYHAAGKVSQ